MITAKRKGPARAPKLGSRPLNFDRHGDLTAHDLDDDCGATVADLDPLAMRWLARSPVERSVR